MITYLQLEPTNYCNLSCAFCNRKDVVSKLKHLELDELKIILEKLKGNDIKDIKFQGLGEPFLNPQFADMCKLLKDCFPKSFLITATNCQHNNLELFSKAMPYIDLCYLSVDGFQKNYEKFRNGAKWEKLVTFFEWISKTRFSRKCSINFLATEHNFGDIPELLGLSDKYQLGEFRINIPQNWNEDEMGVFGNDDHLIDVLRKYKKYVKGKADWDFKDCFWPVSGCYLDAFGNLRVCCLNTSGVDFGNIYKTDVEAMKNSERFVALQEGLKRNQPGRHCKNCDYKRLAPILEKIFID